MAGGVRRRTILAGTAVLLAGGVGVRTYTESHALAARRQAERAPLPESPDLSDLVRYATLAANSHNTQPWRFQAGGGALTIRPDTARRTPVVDPDDHHLFASLGCAAETLAIAARARGMGGEISVAAGADPAIRVDLSPGSPDPSDLFDAIPLRQTTRSLFDGSVLVPEDADRLVKAAEAAGAGALWIAEPDRIAALSDLVVSANTAQLESTQFRAELKSWLRFSRAAALRTGDGLYAAAAGNPVVPDLIGPWAFELALDTEAENEKYAAQIASSAGLLVIVSPTDDPSGWIAAGRACQRAMLTATATGLKCAFVNQPLELANFRADLAGYLGLTGQRPSLLMRVGRADPMPYPVRRPVSDVLML